MEILREFRLRAKLSQSTLAKYLKTTRSQIAMAESGLRNLPDDAFERFRVLTKCSLDIAAVPQNEQDDVAEEFMLLSSIQMHELKRKLEANEWRQFRLEKQMAKINEEYFRLLMTTQTLQKTIKVLPPQKAATVEVDYFKDKEKTTRKKMLTCGKIAQSKLQMSIDLLKAEAEILNRYLGSTTVEPAEPM